MLFRKQKTKWAKNNQEECFKNSWQSSKRMKGWFYIVLNTGVEERRRRLLPKGTEIPGHSPLSAHLFSLHLRNSHGAHFISSCPKDHLCSSRFFLEPGKFWGWKPALQGRRGARSNLEGRMGTRALKPTHFLQEEGGVHLHKSFSQSSACYPTGGNQYSLGVDQDS